MGFVKINIDAGFKDAEGVSLGIVCRDDDGWVLWGISMVQEQVWEPRVAQVVSVFEGVKEAVQRDHSKVVFESNCLPVIDVLQKEKTGRSMLALVLDDILVFRNSFLSISWSYTRRVNNSVAHALAHISPRVLGRYLWSDALPLIANSAVLFDLSLMQ
ncbi:uncharacterized protein LOC141595374 [Silene latifolia]|uniref:uncharacterized protein LOC141595374 n=1 Tax=Silene latifolia TaxID=37657 RepID=UPI003D77A68F